MGFLHDPANFQQMHSKYMQMLDVCSKFAGRLLDHVNTL